MLGNLQRALLYCYCILMSFTSAFAITPVLTIPVIISVLSISVLSFQILKKQSSFVFFQEDSLIICFLLYLFMSYLLNASYANSPKATNHLFAYLFAHLFTYYLLKSIVFNNIITAKHINKLLMSISIGVCLSSLFGIFEFGLKNFLEIDINEFVPRVTVSEYSPTIFGTLTRIRGFVEESGHFSLYLEVFAPMTVYYFFQSDKFKILKYIFCLIIISALILTFSSSGIFILSIDIIMLCVFSMSRKNTIINSSKIKKNLFIIIILVVCFLFYDNIKEFYETAVVIKAVSSGSADDRNYRISLGLKLLENNNLADWLIGYGPAMYDTVPMFRSVEGSSILVLYLLIILETGLIGLLFYVFFLLCVFKRLFSIKNNYYLQLALGIGYMNALLHYFTIANYWYPWIWFQIILIQFFAVLSDKESSSITLR